MTRRVQCAELCTPYNNVVMQYWRPKSDHHSKMSNDIAHSKGSCMTVNSDDITGVLPTPRMVIEFVV
jgi:hypothetical protein